MKKISLLFVLMLVVSFFSCAKKQVVKDVTVPVTPGEKLIWTTHDKRPGWTVSEPETIEGELAFVGLSSKHAMENEARKDAMRDATDSIVKYIGTLAQEKFQKLQTSFGLSDSIMNPSEATRNFQEQLSAAFASKVKAKEWYIEKWLDDLKQTYYKVYVLAKVPKESIDQAYKDMADSQLDSLRKKRDEETEEKAKNQFENAMKAFEQAKEQGFDVEK